MKFICPKCGQEIDSNVLSRECNPNFIMAHFPVKPLTTSPSTAPVIDLIAMKKQKKLNAPRRAFQSDFSLIWGPEKKK